MDVILPLAIAKSYTYRVPEILNDRIAIGKRVLVQFGRNKVYTAVIEKTHQKAPETYEAKYLTDVLDEHPTVSEKQLLYWNWLASYYMCHPGEVLQAALPTALKLSSETTIVLLEDNEFDRTQLNDKEYLVLEALEMHGRLNLSDVAKIIEQKTTHTLIRSLLEKKIVWIEEELSERYKPKRAAFVRLNPEYSAADTLKDLFETLEKRAPKQVMLLQRYLLLAKSSKEVSKKELLEEIGISPAVFNELVKKEIFTLFEKTVSRLKMDEEDLLEEFELSEAQQTALNEIQEHFRKDKITLLHGVTASGKTQIYIRLIEEQLAKEKQSLFLLPEIGLTTQLINRLRKYFGNKIGVYHSRFNDNERVEVWNNVMNGNYQIILGTRSSIFLPFQDLGLIVVDEEHEGSYKQHDPAPRYQARDAAIYLAGLFHAHVLLGSATPSLESYFNTINEKYALVKLTTRYGGVLLPQIQLADMKEGTKRKTVTSHFSSLLLSEIQTSLEKKEQVILFQNRRGYAPLLICNTCAFTPKCINCDVSLTYHKLRHEMHCHYCGYHQKPLKVCPACGGSHLEMKGFGTEKIEDELITLFPEARIARMDLDTTRTKNSYINLLSDLEDRKIDILVGTQMVAKGLDFEHVNLIGIVNADSMLNYPDFRSYERSFQMMEQVSGRAGRRKKQGKVIIQTFNPNHYLFDAVQTHQYERMYQTEMNERISFKYPPLFRLIRIEVKHKEMDSVQKGAKHLAELLRSHFKQRVLGPEFPPVNRIRNQYINTLLLKFEREGIVLNRVKEIVKECIQDTLAQKIFKGSTIVLDVDPM